jgi:hypothetical protein
MADRLYIEGVKAIIDNRKALELRDDTTMMAVDIFREYIGKENNIEHENLVKICIVCVIMASKINDVYPITINETSEIFEFFSGKDEIIKLEGQVLEKLDYKIPFQSNLITHLEALLGDLNQSPNNEATRIIYKCLPNPLFLTLNNQTLLRALILILNPPLKDCGRVSNTITATAFLIRNIVFLEGSQDKVQNLVVC